MAHPLNQSPLEFHDTPFAGTAPPCDMQLHMSALTDDVGESIYPPFEVASMDDAALQAILDQPLQATPSYNAPLPAPALTADMANSIVAPFNAPLIDEVALVAQFGQFFEALPTYDAPFPIPAFTDNVVEPHASPFEAEFGHPATIEALFGECPDDHWNLLGNLNEGMDNLQHQGRRCASTAVTSSTAISSDHSR